MAYIKPCVKKLFKSKLKDTMRIKLKDLKIQKTSSSPLVFAGNVQ